MIGKKVPGGFVGWDFNKERFHFIDKPLKADIFLCGEGPGWQEAEQGIPFVGATGSEINGLLRRCAGLAREDVYSSNIVKWRTTEDDADPEQEDIERDKPELYAELEIVQPRIIVAVGKIAAQFFLGNDITMDKVHGIPHPPTDPVAKWLGTTILPTYHPAAAIRQADRYSYPVYWDFQQLGRLLRNEISTAPIEDKFPSPAYSYGHDLNFDTLPAAKIVAIDTEGWIDQLWGLSFSFAEGSGYILKAGHPSVIAFNRWLHLHRPTIILHHDLHDRAILRAMGVEVGDLETVDTMILAHLINGIHSRGLKTLSERLVGMKMTSYSKLTHEAEMEIVANYLKRAYDSKRCEHCSGSGEGPKRRVIDEDCSACNGSGRIYGKRVGTTKWCDCSRTVTKCAYCTDGAMWPVPPRVADPETGKISRPWSISRRLKTMVASIEAGQQIVDDQEDDTVDATEEDSGDSPYRARWWGILPELRAPVEAEMGRMPRTTLDDVKDQQKVVNYVGADPDGTIRIYTPLTREVKALGLERVAEIDHGILPILDKMMSNGVLINRPYFEDLRAEFTIEMEEIKERLSDLVGYRINPGSPDQVAELLFNKLEIKPPKLSKKTGKPSTDEKTLELIKMHYAFDERVGPIISLVIDHRECQKLSSTYIDAALELAGKDGRVRCDLLYTNIPTGRLAARNPNMLALPVRSDRGKRVAKGFIARPGCVLLSVDMDQIEMRIGAHLSRDANLMNLFIEGRRCSVRLREGSCRCHDPHWATASRMHGIPVAEVTKDQRYPAKVINFGTFYGMTETRLINELALIGVQISRKEATAFLRAWFEAYPGARTYLNNCYAEARTTGAVRTILGRIRYLPGVYSTIDRVREEALRQSGNSPVQGSAADVFKSALIKIDREVLPEMRAKGYCEPILPVHDAVVFEVEEGLEPLVQQHVEWAMAHAMKLNVPLGASGAVSNSLGGLK